MAAKSSLLLLLLLTPILFLAIYLPTSVWEVVNRCANLGEETMVFYVQEVASGANATISTAGGVNGSSSNISVFGSVFVIDNSVTQGSDKTSKLLGRLQGLEANSALNGANFHMLSSLIFEDGSTLQIHGTIITPLTQRELSVVGGTGRFRYARGYVVVEVVASDGVNLTFKFNVTIRSHRSIFKELHRDL